MRLHIYLRMIIFVFEVDIIGKFLNGNKYIPWLFHFMTAKRRVQKHVFTENNYIIYY
jgi:hypothetical protein